MFTSVTKGVTERDEVTKSPIYDKFMDKFVVNSCKNEFIQAVYLPLTRRRKGAEALRLSVEEKNR